MLGYALLQVNPEAAHAFATDAEMDARFDHVYNRTRPALHCQIVKNRWIGEAHSA
jgi:hypothetical protein